MAEETQEVQEEQIDAVADEAKAAFLEAHPELDEETYDLMSDEDREFFIRQGLERESKTDGHDDPTGRETPDADGDGTGSTDWRALMGSRLDVDAIGAEYAAMAEEMGVEEGAAKRLAGPAQRLATELNGMKDYVVALVRQVQAEVIGPQKWNEARSQVEGATQADVDAAKKLIESGEVSSHKAALEFAKLRRERMGGKRPEVTAAVKAYQAQMRRKGGRSSAGSALDIVPGDLDQRRRLYEAEMKAQG